MAETTPTDAREKGVLGQRETKSKGSVQETATWPADVSGRSGAGARADDIEPPLEEI